VSSLGDGPLLNRDEAAFVSSRRVGYLATTYPNGRPHLVPVSPVLDLDRLVFGSELATQKIANIRDYPRVVVGFDEYSEDWSRLKQVILHGEAMILEEGFEFRRDRQLLYEAFPQYEQESPIEEGDSVIVEVRVDRVYSWGFR
jgi:nitroimidazol reductase NimA-like FMN-containing flavoprotein (pyridoxamine 5'-phosphate oxidase superfamily)